VLWYLCRRKQHRLVERWPFACWPIFLLRSVMEMQQFGGKGRAIEIERRLVYPPVLARADSASWSMRNQQIDSLMSCARAPFSANFPAVVPFVTLVSKFFYRAYGDSQLQSMTFFLPIASRTFAPTRLIKHRFRGREMAILWCACRKLGRITSCCDNSSANYVPTTIPSGQVNISHFSHIAISWLNFIRIFFPSLTLEVAYQ
jgi:hypothetical protein